MSRSHKKFPVTGMTTCKSEKKDKSAANRMLRASVRGALAVGAEIMPLLREVSNVWTFGKDGKQWWRKRADIAKRK